MKEMDEFDWSEFLPDFIESAKENIEAVNSSLLKLEENSGDKETLEEIYRRAHNLKGASLTIGFEKMGKLAHAMEDIFKDFYEEKRKPSPETFNVLYQALDQIDRLLQEVASYGKERKDITQILEKLNVLSKEALDTKIPPESTAAPVSQHDTQPTLTTLRVSTDELDVVFNLINETVTSKGIFREKVRELKALECEFEESQKYLKAVCKDLQKLQDTPPSDVSQLFTQAHAANLRLCRKLKNFIVGLEEEFDRDESRIKEIQERIMKMRMLPLSIIVNTLRRNVRDLAKQFQKEVEFKIEGQETRVDKRILEEITDPLFHLIRNSIDHGIEPVEERKKLGKNPRGLLRLTARHLGGKVIIEVEDDGRGIDLQKVKAKALEKGLLKEEAIHNLKDEDLLNLIFLSGFSTSAIITDISGRGVGLDVVKNNIERLKGKVEITTKENQGTKFTLTFPLTLITDSVVLVRVAERNWAIPTSFVQRLLRCSRDEIRIINNKRALLLDERVVPLIPLRSALGYSNGQPSGNGKWLQALILNSSNRKVAFEVDELLGNQEIVVKSLGSHLRKVDKITGATILTNGQIGLIVDVSQLILAAAWEEDIAIRKPEIATPMKRERARVLVVEDQLTTQQLEKSILEAAGFQVDTARDGVEALEKLSMKPFDLVVTDIKMPNMDGFSLTRNIKRNDRYRHIPVIMVTAMEKQEDKKRGIQAGADAYIVKSKFEQGNLIDTVKLLIGH